MYFPAIPCGNRIYSHQSNELRSQGVKMRRKVLYTNVPDVPKPYDEEAKRLLKRAGFILLIILIVIIITLIKL